MNTSLCFKSFIFLILDLTLSAPLFADVKEVSLDEVLLQVEARDPAIEAARFREKAARENIGVSQSNYLPSVSFEAQDSTGFPGSSGLTGIGGLMGSPYRSGATAGLVAKQVLWDFGQTSSRVALAEEQVSNKNADTKIKRLQVKENAVKAFFDCSFYRSQMEVWKYLGEETELVTKEVKKFVATGQRSVVDSYLSQGQEEEAITNTAEIKQKLLATVERLEILMGKTQSEVICPLLPNNIHSGQNAESATNILIKKAEADTLVAQAQVREAKSGYMPKLVVVGSIGTMENSRLVGEQDYSAAVGLIFPLFEGFKTSHEVSSAEATKAAREADLAVAKQDVSEINIRFDENLNSSKVRLEHLKSEMDLANKAFSTAKKRYLSLQGTLTDVREALRNLLRTQTQKNEALAIFLRTQKLKELFNE